MKRYYLYIHINKVNGKVYVGWTGNPKYRWNYGHGYSYNKHFFSAIKKYGWSKGFLHIIVRSDLSYNEALDLERRYIYLFRANDPQFGYNQTEGGEGCDKGKDSYSKKYQQEYDKQHYEENREERKAHQRQYYQDNKEAIKKKSKIYQDAHKEKIREYMRKYRDEHREKFREYQRKYSKKNPNI